MADEAEQRVDWIALDRAIHGHTDPAELDEPTRAEYDAIVAQGPIEAAEPSEADQAAAKFWSDVVQYEADAEADLEAKGIDPNGPESHEYFQQIEQLRP